MALGAMTGLSYATPVVGQTFRHVSWIPESRKLFVSYWKKLPGGKIGALLPERRLIVDAQRWTSVNASGSAQSQTSVDAEEAEDRTQKCLEDLAETLILPQDYLSKLPDGLKVDLNDAAFALSSGPITQECGETVGKLVMGLSLALEQSDTQTAAALAKEVPSIQNNLPSDPFSNAALGKRLQAAGRYLASTGQYGNGELQKLSEALLAAGEAFSLSGPDLGEKAPPTESSRMFKFGVLQVELTAQRAYIGAAVAFVFGVLCWNFTSGLTSNDVDPSQYASDNAFTVASSLKGTLLTAGYACTVLSAFSMVGLVALASQMGPKDTP